MSSNYFNPLSTLFKQGHGERIADSICLNAWIFFSVSLIPDGKEFSFMCQLQQRFIVWEHNGHNIPNKLLT